MIIKNGPEFRVLGLRAEILHAQPIIIGVYEEYDHYVKWTSGVDRQHSWGSDHYKGDSLDVWWDDSLWPHGAEAADKIRERLGRDYDVLKEAWHIHIEYDPKTGVNK